MSQLPPEAIAALERGNLIEAIKIVRDRTGMDLKSSKEAVEHYANSGALAPSARADWQEDDWGRDEAAAKQLVEAHQNAAASDFGQQPSSAAMNPMAEPGRVSSGGFEWLPVIVVLLIAAAAWWYFKGV